jgi:hypothetical protein
VARMGPWPIMPSQQQRLEGFHHQCLPSIFGVDSVFWGYSGLCMVQKFIGAAAKVHPRAML